MSSTPGPQTFRVAVGFALAQRYISFVLQLAVAVVLARLLSPTETGIFALAAAIVAVCHLVREFGLAEYLIAEREITRSKLRAAFTVTFLSSVLISGGLALSVPLIATAYGERGLENLLYLLCVNFALMPLGTVAAAMLHRAVRFDRLFVVQTGSAVASAVVTLTLAFHGFSYMSMAYGAIAGTLALILSLLAYDWRNVLLLPTSRGLGSVFRFGGVLTGARLLEQMATRSVDFVVSASLGFHANGVLSKANTIGSSFGEFFNSAVVRAATPKFARMEVHAPSTRDAYLRGTVVAAMALWIFFPFVAVNASDIVWLLFGAQWTECVELIQIGAIGSLFHAPFLLSFAWLTALGVVRVQLSIQLIFAPVTFLSVLVAAQYSLVWVALALSICGCLKLLLVNRAMKRECHIGAGEVWVRLRLGLGIAIVVALASAAVKWVLMELEVPRLMQLALVGVVTITCSLVAIAATGHPAHEEVKRAWSALRSRLQRR